MKKTLIMLTGLVAINIVSWQMARSQQTKSITESADESQIILAEYQWNGRKIEISLADFKVAIGELSFFQQENYASKTGENRIPARVY